MLNLKNIKHASYAIKHKVAQLGTNLYFSN